VTERAVVLPEAEEAGDEARTKCLDAAIDILAHGVAERKRQAGRGVHTATLERTMAGIRVHDRRKHGGSKESVAMGDVSPLGPRVGGERELHVASCRRPK
jgi:hypothetical protein